MGLSKNVSHKLDDLTKRWHGLSVTPAVDHLFNINPDATKLNSKDLERYHHVVAQLLFLCKKRSTQCQNRSGFLTTRVKSPDIDDEQKLKRVIHYLQGTSYLVLILKYDHNNTIIWWIDAAFAVHKDYKSHTRGILTMGKGAIYATSTKKN